MPNNPIQFLHKITIEAPGERKFPVDWFHGANVAVLLDRKYFTLYVDRPSSLDLRNGWTAGRQVHKNAGLHLYGWHFRDSFMDGKTGDDETISFKHFLKFCEGSIGIVFFFKVKFDSQKYYMVTIAQLIRDFMEIHGYGN